MSAFGDQPSAIKRMGLGAEGYAPRLRLKPTVDIAPWIPAADHIEGKLSRE